MVGPGAGGEWPDGVVIVGPENVMIGLTDIDGLYIFDHGQRLLDDGRWEVSGRATPAAATEARARGCTVTVLATGAELRRESEDRAGERGGPVA